MLAILLLGDRNRFGGMRDEDDVFELLERKKKEEVTKKEKQATYRKNNTMVWNSAS